MASTVLQASSAELAAVVAFWIRYVQARWRESRCGVKRVLPKKKRALPPSNRPVLLVSRPAYREHGMHFQYPIRRTSLSIS